MKVLGTVYFYAEVSFEICTYFQKKNLQKKTCQNETHYNRQDDDAEYILLADEIFAAEQGDPTFAKKKLKWDRKFRVEESNFETRKKEIEVQIEAYKRDFDDMQPDISTYERLIKSKMQKLDEIRKEIKRYQT